MAQHVAQSWDLYWGQHEAAAFVNYTPQLTEMLRKHLDLSHCTVLEVGCGTGGNASILAALGARIIALDISALALARTLATAERAGVRVAVVRGDTQCLPFATGIFDVVFHQGLLEHFRQPLGILHEQRRVLRSGGFLLVDVPQRYNLYTVVKHWRIRQGRWPYGRWETEFSLEELAALLRAAGFRMIDFYGRGYYPRPLEMLRNLAKIETKVLKRSVFPSSFWDAYADLWHRLEKTRFGCHVLQNIGVLAQASDV